MTFREELNLLLKSRVAVIQIVTYDESRVLEDLRAVRAKDTILAGMGIYSWDPVDQFAVHEKGEPVFDVSKKASATTVLNEIEAFGGPAVFLLPDYHLQWNSISSTEAKVAVRKMRALTRRLPKKDQLQSILIITPVAGLPAELRHDVVQLEAPKPDVAAIVEILNWVVGRERIEERLINPLSQAALGLSGVQTERTFRKAFTAACERSQARLDERAIDLIREEKYRIIRDSGALEFVTHTESPTSVGGLEVLREWLTMRREAFGVRAAAYGLEPPRGLALVGIPGTGKSLCAKVAASIWRMPLLRLDMGAVFQGVLGSSERNIREAIEISELVSPCILWVDEIEKSFGGSSGDSGTASRVLATFLTWMQEKSKPVCTLATANDVDRLPPEFLRKGRFDEVFFLDLPTRQERAAILKVHLGKRGYARAEQRFEMDQVLDRTEGFVGAELEAMVKDAMFPAFLDGERQLESRDLLRSAGEMVPLARSRSAHIENLRKLVKAGEARNAGRGSEETQVRCDAIRTGRMLDL